MKNLNFFFVLILTVVCTTTLHATDDFETVVQDLTKAYATVVDVDVKTSSLVSLAMSLQKKADNHYSKSENINDRNSKAAEHYARATIYVYDMFIKERGVIDYSEMSNLEAANYRVALDLDNAPMHKVAIEQARTNAYTLLRMLTEQRKASKAVGLLQTVLANIKKADSIDGIKKHVDDANTSLSLIGGAVLHYDAPRSLFDEAMIMQLKIDLHIRKIASKLPENMLSEKLQLVAIANNLQAVTVVSLDVGNYKTKSVSKVSINHEETMKTDWVAVFSE